MVRFAFLTVAAVILAGAAGARAEDSDEVKRLKVQIELLQAKLEAAALKVDKLEKEYKLLKAGVAKVPAAAAKEGSLADILTDGIVIKGDYKFITDNKSSGEWSLTIKERTGKKFTGIYSAKEISPNNKREEMECDAEGEIVGNGIKFRTVNTTKAKASVAGAMKKETLHMTWTEGTHQARMVAKITK